MDNKQTCSFIPPIFQSALPDPEGIWRSLSEGQRVKTEKESTDIKNYIDLQFEKLIKPRLEFFENEDIKPNLMVIVTQLQDSFESCVKKTGDVITGPLNILKPPEAKLDAVNKEYVDWLFLKMSETLNSAHFKNRDLDMNFYNIKNVTTPHELADAATKGYVDQKIEEHIIQRSTSLTIQHIFSKGQVMIKKTFFFNPGFICPQEIHITSVGFSTSPYKYKIGDQPKLGEYNPTKLYFMIDNEIKSEYVIEKDVQLGHVLKEFEEPIIISRGANLMMVVEQMIDDASVNISFY